MMETNFYEKEESNPVKKEVEVSDETKEKVVNKLIAFDCPYLI